MAAPKWFETTTYFNNKLAQMQRDEPEANWTADTLTTAFEASGYNVNSADSMYTHFEQYGNTVNERVSPNQYFDNDYYMNSKLAQMQATNPGYTMAQLETAMFAEGNMSPWTHYTLYGFAEGIDPSAGFNTNDYMAAKLAQMQATDPSYTMDRLFEAFRAGNLNPIEHYFEYGVNENLAYTPVTPTEYNDIALAAGEHEYVGTAGDDNFMASVVSSSSKSTLQNDDSIDGAGGNDMLTVDMGANWNGFSDKGGMTNVETVNLNNSGSRAYTFDATGIEGAQTYNIDGNVNLSNLARAGITVNLSNVNNNAPYELNFNADAVKGDNDSLTLGISNMPEYVTVKGNGIEHVTVNSTGDEANYVWLRYMDGTESVKITGDAKANVALSKTVTTIDATEAEADTFVCTRYSDLVKSIEMGDGDDSFTLRSITPDAVVNGGAGYDTGKLYNTSGAYQLQMDGVEALNIVAKANYSDQAAQDPTAALILDGSLTTGLQAVGLAGGNGYTNAGVMSTERPITLVNYDMNELAVNVSGKNNVDLTIADIENITLGVGDGDATTADLIRGSVTLTDAKSVAVNVADTANATFSAALNAANATSLSLSNSQNSTLNVTRGDLSAVSQLTVDGYGNVTIGAAAEVGTDAKNVDVNAQGLIGGTFTSQFVGNSTSGGATLNFTGSTTGKSDITVDGTYKSINITTGINDDKVTLNSRADAYTAQNLTGDLGYGNDVVVVKGSNVSGDFTGLKGVTMFDFRNMTTAEVQAAIYNKTIKIGDAGFTAYDGGSVAPEDVVVIPGEQKIPSDTAPDAPVRIESNLDPDEEATIQGKPGQTNSYVGTISNSTTITGNTGSGAGTQAGVEVAFGTATEAADDSALNVTAVPELAIVGGTDASKPNSFTGAIDPTTNGAASTSITTGTARDTVDLIVNQVEGQSTTINNTGGASGEKFAVEVKGAGETTVTSADFENVIVAAAATGTTTLNSTAAAEDAVKVTTASSGETIVNTNAEAATQTVELVASGTGAVTINAAESTQTVKVEGSVSNEATPLVLSGNENTTFTVDGSQMGKLSNLTVSGAGDTTITDLDSTATSFDLTTDGNVTFENTTLNSVKTFTVDATGAESAVVVQGGIANSDAVANKTEEPKYVGLYGVETLNVESDGVVNFTMQLGKASSGPITVDATKCDGGLILDGAGFCSKGGTFKGGKGDDYVFVNGEDGTYNMSLGAGDDELGIWLGYAEGYKDNSVSDTVSVFDVTLGAGADTIGLIGQKGYYANGGAYIKVNDFNTAEDKLDVIEASFQGGAFVSWGTLADDNAKIAAFINGLHANAVTADQVKNATLSGDKCLTIGTGAGAVTYVAFVTNDSGSGQTLSDWTTEVKQGGCALIELQGVAFAGVDEANAIFAN